MIHPIFGAALKHPDLLVEHLTNYFRLFKEEASDIAKSLAIRAAAGAVAAVALLLALGLTGVAIMLGAVEDTFHWALVVVPAVAWLTVVAGVVLALRPTLAPQVHEVTSQFEADRQLLQTMKAQR